MFSLIHRRGCRHPLALVLLTNLVLCQLLLVPPAGACHQPSSDTTSTVQPPLRAGDTDDRSVLDAGESKDPPGRAPVAQSPQHQVDWMDRLRALVQRLWARRGEYPLVRPGQVVDGPHGRYVIPNLPDLCRR